MRLKKQTEHRCLLALCGVLLISYLFATIYTGFNPFELLANLGESVAFLVQDFWPPRFLAGAALWQSILVTVALAISSVFTASILASIAAVLGSERTAPFPWLSGIIREAATFLRNIPTLVWAFILFSALGVGTSVGFMALTITSSAFLTRTFIETIDEVPAELLESMTVVGATFWQRIFQAVLPACAGGLVSWILYSLEVNIRSSTIVGMVGGGGCGMLLLTYLKAFKYQQAAGLILLIALLVIGVDALTNWLRKKVVLA